MRVTKKELLDKLGVGYELGPYETFPLSYCDAETSATCSAEVRMDPDGTELEAEVQMMYDTPPAGKPPMEQVFWIRARPSGATEEWEILELKLRGAPPEEEIYNWQEKSCNFFKAVAQELQNDTMPDIDELIDREFHSRERLGDQRQGGGGRAQRMKTVPGMKKGGSF